MANITAGVTGNITAISEDGLTLTVDGTVASTDVGRIIMLTNNTSHPGRYRLIDSVNTTDGTYTLTNKFGTSVFRNLPSTANNSTNNATNELDVAVNDTYVISRTLAEEAAVNADLEEVADTNNYFRTTGTITFRANCLLYDEDITLELDWQDHFRYSSANGSVKSAGLILGRQNFGPDDTDTDTGGWTSNSCNFIETSSNFISGTYDDPIAFHMNGGFWRGTAGTSDNGVFYRFNDGQDQSFRFWNVNITGKFGGRVAGDYSVFYGNRSNNNDSGFAILNPLRMAVFQDNSVKGGIQALYSFPHTASSTTVLATEIDDIQTRIIRLNGNNTSTNNNSVSTIANWDFDAIDRSTTAGADLIAVENHGSRTTVHDWVKDYELTVTTADGDEMDRLGELILEDDAGTQTTDSDDSLGNFPAQRLIAYKNTVANTNTNVSTLTSGTTYTPYNWAIKYRGHNLITGNTDLRAPFGPIQLSRPALVDANVTDTVANIDALTEIANDEELYDYADKFKHENMSMPTAQTQFFTKSGTDVVVTNSAYDVTFNSGASNVMAWNADDELITVKTAAAGYTGGIECSTFTTDTEIRGAVNATTIVFSQTLTSGQDIINTGTGDEVRGALSLPPGTYVIRNADVSNLSVSNNSTDLLPEDVILSLVGTTGTPTTNSNVSIEVAIDVTVSGLDNTDGRISFFDTDSDTAFHEDTDVDSDFSISSADHIQLTTGNVIRVVYSGGAAKDFSVDLTLTSGANPVTINPASQAYPSLNSDAQTVYDQYTSSSTVSYAADSDELTVNIIGDTNSGAMGDGTFNNFLHTFVRGTTAYNEAVKDLGTEPGTSGNNLIDSIGAESGGRVNGKYVSITPGDNRTYNVGYVENTDSDSPQASINVTRTVVDTGDSSITFDFTVEIPSSPSAFDIATTASAVSNSVEGVLDERGVITQNMQNIAVNEAVFVDSNGTKQFAPDYS